MIAIGALALAACSSPADGVEVRRSDFGRAWPLTVTSGVLNCEGLAVTFTANGTTYAVNGFARQMDRWPDINPIWADAGIGLGYKKDIGPLIERGLELCGP